MVQMQDDGISPCRKGPSGRGQPGFINPQERLLYRGQEGGGQFLCAERPVKGALFCPQRVYHSFESRTGQNKMEPNEIFSFEMAGGMREKSLTFVV